MNNREIFAKNLKMYMEQAEKNQKEMAVIIGVSAPTFHDWLNAKKMPRIEKMQALADYFGITKADLIEDSKSCTGEISTFSKNVRKRRIQLNMTQEELALKLGYTSKSTINKIEKGINDVSQSQIKEFAEALSTTQAALLGLDDPVHKTINIPGIGNRIKARRKELGLTADELGQLTGKDRATIYRYENGDIEHLPLEVLHPLADALETTPDYLMGTESKPAESVEKVVPIEELLETLRMLYALPEDKKKTVKQMVADYYNAFADGR